MRLQFLHIVHIDIDNALSQIQITYMYFFKSCHIVCLWKRFNNEMINLVFIFIIVLINLRSTDCAFHTFCQTKTIWVFILNKFAFENHLLINDGPSHLQFVSILQLGKFIRIQMIVFIKVPLEYSH